MQGQISGSEWPHNPQAAHHASRWRRLSMGGGEIVWQFRRELELPTIWKSVVDPREAICPISQSCSVEMTRLLAVEIELIPRHESE
jgi:hypothetical protein